MNAAITNAAKAIASLDASPFNTKIELSRAEITTITAAIDKANERQAEIQRILLHLREEGRLSDTSGFDIAEQLLAGDLELAVRPDVDALNDELRLLGHGVMDLRRRVDAERQAIEATQSAMKAAIGAECLSLAEQFEAEAKEAVGILVDIYAASAALATVAPNNHLAYLRRKLATAIAAMCNSNDQIDPRAEGLTVPSSINPVLEAIRAFDPTLANSVPSNIGVPRD